MPEPTSEYRLDVELVGHDPTVQLLRVSSALHRRNVPVLAACLGRPVEGRRTFTAHIVATDRQAHTVADTLRGLVDVLDVEMAEVRRRESRPRELGS